MPDISQNMTEMRVGPVLRHADEVIDAAERVGIISGLGLAMIIGEDYIARGRIHARHELPVNLGTRFNAVRTRGRQFNPHSRLRDPVGDRGTNLEDLMVRMEWLFTTPEEFQTATGDFRTNLFPSYRSHRAYENALRASDGKTTVVGGSCERTMSGWELQEGARLNDADDDVVDDIKEMPEAAAQRQWNIRVDGAIGYRRVGIVGKMAVVSSFIAAPDTVPAYEVGRHQEALDIIVHNFVGKDFRAGK